MTDKEKQIEEMARDIAFEFCPNRNLHKKWGNEAQCYSDDNFSECTTIKNAVDKLYNAGYRKIPEGSVVMSKEEFDEDYVTKQDRDYWKNKTEILGNKLKQAHKETSREFAEKLENGIDNLDIILHEDNDEQYVSINQLLKFMDEIAKQFGVEVEE